MIWNSDYGKRIKCCLPAFSPFSTLFSISFFFEIVKSQDSVVLGLSHTGSIGFFHECAYVTSELQPSTDEGQERHE